MKVKSIITCGLLLLGVGAATTSCEDMFTAENHLVSTDLAPKDSVYQMMGIVKRMQKLADRTILLGEVRADLVDVNSDVASTDLQQLYNNDIDTDNVYNKPADYYDVINNCNIYLAYVDEQLKTHGTAYYGKEIAAVKCFRAWCYLELAKIYGEVPFVIEPVLTADDAENIVSSGSKADMGTILDFCIADLEEELAKNPSINLEMRPYLLSTNGTLDGTWPVSSQNFFLPVRAILAELYLWRGTYEDGKSGADAARDYYVNAINLYHEYFCFPNEERGVRNNTTEWSNRDHTGVMVSYTGRFGVSVTSENIAILPCDTSTYYGNTSDLRTVFNSQYKNNYYPWVVPSTRLRDISANQQYCYRSSPSSSDHEIYYFSQDPSEYSDPMMVGDLRLYSVYRTESNSGSKENANFSASRSWVAKWTNGSYVFQSEDQKNAYIPFYRNTILYLHMAEALNRAGFPETAFAVLKYGLTKDVMDNRSIISQSEYDALCEIKIKGFELTEPQYAVSADTLLNNKTAGSFVIWPSTVFYNPDNANANSAPDATIAQIGIHSIGSGFSELNTKYYLPTDSSGIVPVPEKPAFMEEPEVPLDYETWCEQEKWDPTLDLSRMLYQNYLDDYKYDEKKAVYDEWCITYPQELAAYEEALATNDAWLASDDVRKKRMIEVEKLILEEEALEGMFEGQRFYDLMRYQMRAGEIPSIKATIKMPEYINEKYGETRIEGRPWYLTLPAR
ncbi:MAG: RagB/SusD family nutrient uptake outer membrane protein [Prevotellaceae bacterium]|nr:RagB/SusD family nutrient uptake outer membrane protein [Prevotellaceae bacterium]